MEGVVGRALRGGVYLFLQRILTFSLQSVVLRKLHLSVTGVVSVQLELALASCFFLRDGFRLAFLRAPSLIRDTTKENTKVKVVSETTIQQLVNVTWLSTAVTCVVAMGITAYTFIVNDNSSAKADELDQLAAFPYTMALYCLSAAIEAVGEPLYLLAHCSLLMSVQVSAQSMALIVRSIAQYFCIIYLDLGLLGYGFAEVASACTILLVLVLYFSRQLQDEESTFALQSLRQFLPNIPKNRSDGIFDRKLLTILGALSLQSGVKYLLTEGDKWVLSSFASLENMGVYGIVFHLGSLVPRLLFRPIEDAAKPIFSKLGTTHGNDNASTQAVHRILIVLLRGMLLLGLTFITFGYHFTSTLVLLLYGPEKVRLHVSSALSTYCIYILFLGFNGVCESFVHAVGNEKQLMKLNQWLIAFFVIYAMTAALLVAGEEDGAKGIILANCVNMGCRILYCMQFMGAFFIQINEPDTSQSPTVLESISSIMRTILPNRWVLASFAITGGVLRQSYQTLVLPWENQMVEQEIDIVNLSVWKMHAMHVAIGGVTFILTAIVVYVMERKSIVAQVQAVRESQKSHSE